MYFSCSYSFRSCCVSVCGGGASNAPGNRSASGQEERDEHHAQFQCSVTLPSDISSVTRLRVFELSGSNSNSSTITMDNNISVASCSCSKQTRSALAHFPLDYVLDWILDSGILPLFKYSEYLTCFNGS